MIYLGTCHFGPNPYIEAKGLDHLDLLMSWLKSSALSTDKNVQAHRSNVIDYIIKQNKKIKGLGS